MVTLVPKVNFKTTGRTDPGPSPEIFELLRDAGKKSFGERYGEHSIRADTVGEGDNGKTVTQQTLIDYARRGAALLKRWRRETGQFEEDTDLDYVSFVTWLFGLKPNIRAGTWRNYRQSAKHIIQAMPDDNAQRALELLENDIIEPISKTKSKAEADEDEAESAATKEKKISYEDFNKILVWLQFKSRSETASHLMDWMISTIFTGLRPIEWRMTELKIEKNASALNGQYVWLYVLSAKATNGRSTGIVRTLDLSFMDPAKIKIIKRHSDRWRNWFLTGEFDQRKGRLVQLFNRAVQNNTKKQYTLYTLRHQAIANFKSVLSMEETAAIVGHGVTATQAAHYGKKRSTWGPERIGEPPKGIPEEIALVRNSIVTYAERMAMGGNKDKFIAEFPIE